MNGERLGEDTGEESGEPAVVALPAETRSVARARRHAREILAEWDAEAFEWAASQLVSELVTNVVLHAGTDFEMALSLHGSRLRCEVSDASARPPRLRSYGADASTGRGLRLVEQLSAAWGVIPRQGGKTVWFELEEAAGHSGEDPDLEGFLGAEDLAGAEGGDAGAADEPRSRHRNGVPAGAADRAAA